MKLSKDWKTRLVEAEKRGRFTDDDLQQISSFDTCFIGEHHDKHILSFRELTKREDELGSEAFRAIYADDIKKAKRIYREVQRLYKDGAA